MNALQLIIRFVPALAIVAIATSRTDGQTSDSISARSTGEYATEARWGSQSSSVTDGATGQTLYATSGFSNLYSIDDYATSPQAVVIGTSGVVFFDMAIDPTTGLGYGITPGNLYSLDLLTADATLIGATGVGALNALEFACDGTLYSWGFGNTILYEIDPTTGVATLVVDTGHESAGDLAFDPTDGSLYGATSSTLLIRIDLETLQTMVVGPLSLGDIFGLEIDDEGTMYAAQHRFGGLDSRLYLVNKSTAATTLIGDIAGSASLGGVFGMAFSGPPCCTKDAQCDDGDACTDDSCDPDDPNAGDFGCVHTDVNCDDGVGCTIDGCDHNAGCTHDPDDSACDDGEFCNGEETCDPIKDCQAGDDSCTDPDFPVCDEEGDQCVPLAVERTLIIKQGACPAPVNPNSNGVIPMLLVGDADFDVNAVDLDSLELRRCDGGGEAASPLAQHTSVKDLNHPFDGSVECDGCSCNEDQSSDGIDDLSMKFRTRDVVDVLELNDLPGGAQVELVLSGSLLDGTAFTASDCIVILPPGDMAPANAHVESNVADTFVEVAPLDLNFDDDGFADFSRSYYSGTAMTLTAPVQSQGRRFVRWLVDGVPQPIGMRTVEVAVSEDTTLKAAYARPARATPVHPTESDDPLE